MRDCCYSGGNFPFSLLYYSNVYCILIISLLYYTSGVRYMCVCVCSIFFLSYNVDDVLSIGKPS